MVGEQLLAFLRGHDRFPCALRDHGEYRVEAQFYQDEEFLIGRLAVQWAEEELKSIETTGSAS